MFGIIAILPDGLEAPGVLFADGYVYIHEPVADGWSSKEDFLSAMPGAMVKIIGPVVPVQSILEEMEEKHQQTLRVLQEEYERARQQFAKYMEAA